MGGYGGDMGGYGAGQGGGQGGPMGGYPNTGPYYGSAPPPMPYGPAKQQNPPPDIKCRKLFIGAIGSMTEETFYNYFTKFGPIEDYIVFRD